MDFLEGALLGRYWSDTDFETRRHKGLALLLSACFWGAVLLGAFLINFRSLPFLLSQRMSWLLLYVILFLVNPAIGFYYYKLPLILRFGALGALLLKFVSLYMGIVAAVIPLLRVPADFSLNTILGFFEETVGNYVETQAETYGWNGLMLSGIVSVLIMGIAFLLIAYLLVKLPQWIYKTASWIQRVYDESVSIFFKNRRHRSRKPISPIETRRPPADADQPQTYNSITDT